MRAAGRVRTPAVEEAFRTIPRHLFLPGIPVRAAYADEAVAVQHVDGVATSSASQPSMMAIMLEQLDVRPGHRVLEIGAGTGYNAALLAHLVGPDGMVTAVDIDAELVDRAAENLANAGVEGVQLHCADGALGHPPGVPYDRIVLTVGSPDVRPEWVAQLAPGGRLLLPLTLRGSQLSVALDLGRDGALHSHSVRSCAFIRLRGIAAGVDAVRPLRTPGLVLQPADPTDPAAAEPTAVDAALAEPGPIVAVARMLRAGDLWDGFGLYLAVTSPGACRLLVVDDEAAAAGGAAPMIPGRGTVALAGAGGLAVLVDGPGRRTGVRAFGPAGAVQATRLLAAFEAWVAAGHPDAAELRLLVRPRSDDPATRAGYEPDGLTTVLTKYCRITVGW